MRLALGEDSFGIRPDERVHHLELHFGGGAALPATHEMPEEGNKRIRLPLVLGSPPGPPGPGDAVSADGG
jgi:hypothetical protein